jgi:hypothetical protein
MEIVKKIDVFVKFYEYITINILLNFIFKVNFNANETFFLEFVRLINIDKKYRF